MSMYGRWYSDRRVAVGALVVGVAWAVLLLGKILINAAPSTPVQLMGAETLATLDATGELYIAPAASDDMRVCVEVPIAGDQFMKCLTLGRLREIVAVEGK